MAARIFLTLLTVHTDIYRRQEHSFRPHFPTLLEDPDGVALRS